MIGRLLLLSLVAATGPVYDDVMPRLRRPPDDPPDDPPQPDLSDPPDVAQATMTAVAPVAMARRCRVCGAAAGHACDPERLGERARRQGRTVHRGR